MKHWLFILCICTAGCSGFRNNNEARLQQEIDSLNVAYTLLQERYDSLSQVISKESFGVTVHRKSDRYQKGDTAGFMVTMGYNRPGMATVMYYGPLQKDISEYRGDDRPVFTDSVIIDPSDPFGTIVEFPATEKGIHYWGGYMVINTNGQRIENSLGSWYDVK